ncbi:MAG TPA: hypothetical protein PLZ75_14095, partial [Bacteroidales bacterium]|nr:hypothetical protein [Bacteroidales bacterium]
MEKLYNYSLVLIFSLAVIVFLLLFFISAPYGKFRREGWGPVIRAKWAWLIMEFISPVLMIFFFIISDRKSVPAFIFISLWLMHYVHRTFIYPFTQSGRNKPMPLILVVFAIVFNSLNGLVNGYGIFHIYSYDLSWLLSWQFLAGAIVFISGFIINKTADEKLRRLRNENPNEYVI